MDSRQTDRVRRDADRAIRSMKVRRENARLLAVLAVFVSLAVAGITMQGGRAMTHEEQVLDCPVAADGSVAHTHDDSCYDEEGRLVCLLPEVEAHVHDESCYTEELVLVCGLEEGEGAHYHDDSCYDGEGNPTCGLEESDGHVHTDDCYEVTRTLTCGKDEIAEEHVHGQGCFRTVVVDDGEACPAQSFQHEFKDADDRLQLRVSVEAPEGALPEGTTMKAEWVDTEADANADVQAAIDDAVAKRTDGDGRIDSVQAVDITFLDADGAEVEPAVPVTVTMTSPQIADAATDSATSPLVVHVESEREAIERGEELGLREVQIEGQVVDPLSERQLAKRDIEAGKDDLVFDAERFSVYAVVYTVDFHYDVDGEAYDLSLRGGDAISLRELLAGLRVFEAKDADLFMAEVEGVEFSDTSLVAVAQVGEDVTAGELRERFGLQAQRSADATDEEIAAMDAKRFQPGDWAVLSLAPFDTEETLTVTMRNGDVFTIKVTDAQISQTFITANGASYEVTVTYGPEAGIPERSSLSVEELPKSSEGFKSAWKLLTGTEKANGQTESQAETDITLGIKAYDISIVDENGNNVEPQSSVQVAFTLKSLPEDVEDTVLESTLAMHHVDESTGQAVIEEVAAIDGTSGNMELVEDSMKAEFTVDSFSTYVISWGSTSNSSTQLQVRSNNRTRATVTIYYVDTDGNPIKRPSSISDTVQTTADSFPYTYSITSNNLAQDISGYTYQSAHADSYQGREVTTVVTTRSGSGYSSSYTATPSSVYLVYSGESSGITVHYGYMQGDTFVEFTNDEDGDVPAGTTVPKPSQYGDQWDLEKTIPGYRYVTSRINDPKSGREISSLLNTDPPYKADTNNTFENANLSDYPSYTSSTAPTSFVSEWRYRQLSSGDWNPTNDRWYYSNTEPVTGLGVTKPVSFDETERDIYVVYEKGSMSGGNGDGDTSDLGELNAPTTDKQVESNHDGTYDVTLSAKSEKRNEESTTKANVVVVLDTSWSMYEKDTGNGQSRLTVAKAAIGSLADKLFALNADESDTIELAFVNFAQRVRNEEEMRTIYSGTDATSFKNMINGLDCASGTNWDDALYAANHIYFNDNDPTYIVFVTDGDPISCAHPYGTYNDWDGGTYYNKRSNYEYALAAKNQADLIIANNKTLYTIGAFGDISNLEAIGGTYLGQASNTKAINGYFDDIISDIQSALGYRDITINDGITALSSTGLASGDISSLRYYRSGGENEDGSEKYDHTANDGHGVKWDEAPDAYLLEVKSEGGVTKFYKNGAEAPLASLTDLTETEYLEKYPVGTRTVIWDINAGSDELLEDGVTYTMIFTMWPSQEAYDLIANLNNHVINYDDLSQAEKDQVYLGDDGVYYLKTNTKATVDYTSVKLVNGEVSGTPTSASATIEDPKGKMNLDTSIMTVRKEFAHLINEEDPYEQIAFYLLVDGKYYNADGTLSDTLDESKVYAINLPNDDGKWEDTIYIAPGLMRGGEILETGHNYSLEEKIVSGNPYEYEFAPQTVRPMVITAVPTFLVEKDNFNANGDNKQEYTINDADSKYVEVDGKSDADGTYYVASENNGSLTGVNHKTSELDITKIVNDPDDLLTSAQEATETFTYRVTLQIPDGCDPSGIVGYEYVPRTQSNAYTLFGYQTGQSAFPEDIERFNGKTYRAWNTLVYDALIEYDRVTENGNTVIRARRDADGKIIWKVSAEGGYHTITYDMTLKQDEVIRFTNLPTGTKYVIQEIYANKYPADNAGGKTDGRTPVADESNLSAEGYEIEQVQHTGGTLSADKTTVTGEIEAPDTRYYNQFTNKKVTEVKATRAELKVKKVVEDYTWGQEYYRFTLAAGKATYTDTEGGTGNSPMPDGTQNSVVSVYDSTAEHTLSFGAIRYTRPGTYTYTVSEYDNSKNMPNVEFASPVTLTVTVTADNNGNLTVSEIKDGKGTTVFSRETDTAVATGLTTQTNTPKKIHIKKVDKDNVKTVLAGAVFEIRSGESKLFLQNGKLLSAEEVKEIIGMAVTADGAEAAMENKQISSTLTLGEAGISGYSYDVVYELKEISAPSGYIIENGSTYFKVLRDGTQIYLRLTDQSGTVLVDGNNEPILDNDNALISDDGLTISVKNEPGVALPAAGGPGTTLLYLIGAVLVTGAAGILLRGKRRTA